MSKRRWLVAALCVAVAVIGGLCIAEASIYREDLALPEGIGFGMSPAEIRRVLGEPVSEEKKTYEVSGQTHIFLTYEMNVLGRPATVRLDCIPHRLRFVLTECSIRFVPSEDTEDFAQALYTHIESALAGREGLQTVPEAREVYISRGPCGTGYDVILDGDGILVRIETNEYYR